MQFYKSITVVFLMITILSCSKNESIPSEKNQLPSNEFEELLDEYGIFYSEVNYESDRVGIDSNTIYFNGRVKDRFVLKGFDKISKKNIISNEKIILDTIVSINEGYGQTSTHQISNFSVQQIHKYGDDYSFILWGWAYGNQYRHTGKQAVSSDLYMVSGLNIVRLKSYSIPDSEFYFNTIAPWFENSFFVELYSHNSGDSSRRWKLYTMDGVEQYESNGLVSSSGAFPINFDEGISLDGDLSYCKRKNFKTGEIIWGIPNPIADLPENARIDNVTLDKIDEGFVECNIQFTQYDGVIGELKYKVDIEKGDFIRLK